MISSDHMTPSPAPFTIQAENVTREYHLGEATVRAVAGISLTIPAGQFLALLGSSGSGKSTFLSMLAGLDRPTTGAIRVGEKNLAELSPENLARYRRETVGMVFQSFNLLPRMTLEENVELPLRLSEVSRGSRAARVQEALDRVRLGARSKHRPSELSGGEQQRGALARALVNGEQILLLLREFQTTLGMTIVMVTHERPLAERFADRIVTLSDGKLISDVLLTHPENNSRETLHAAESHS
jgi:putative ABC transport system ATP-binding protein